MTAKQPKETTKKVFHSIIEFKKHFFPKAHEKELLNKKRQDSDSFGTGLAEEFLEGVQRELRRR